MSKDKQATPSDDARTGEDADANREELARQAQKGLRRASRDLENDQGDENSNPSERKS
jgi:hypothetical protein